MRFVRGRQERPNHLLELGVFRRIRVSRYDVDFQNRHALPDTNDAKSPAQHKQGDRPHHRSLGVLWTVSPELIARDVVLTATQCVPPSDNYAIVEFDEFWRPISRKVASISA